MNVKDFFDNIEDKQVIQKDISRSNELLELIIKDIEKFVLINRYKYITPEHFLYCLMKNDTTSQALVSAGIDLNVLESDLIKYFNDFVPKIQGNPISKSLDWINVCGYAEKYASVFKNDSATFLHVLLSIYDLDDSFAKYFLLKQELLRTHVLDMIENTGKFAVKNIEKLEKIIIMKRHLDPIIGGLLEFQNGNVVLVGKKNTGKSGLLLSLSNLIKNKKLGNILDDYCVVDLNLVEYLANKELGKFVEVLDELETQEKTLAFVDITNVDLSKIEYIIKKYLINDKIKVAFETSEQNFLQSENYRVLKNFVTVCEMNEFNFDEAYEISKYAVVKYEEYYNIRIQEEDIIKIIKNCNNNVGLILGEFEKLGIMANNKLIDH